MQGGSDWDGRGGEDLPWADETHCRVLSQEGSGEGGGVMAIKKILFSEKTIFFLNCLLFSFFIMA